MYASGPVFSRGAKHIAIASPQSGTGRGAGVLTLNPQGLHHGPKRADLELAQKEWRRDARLEGCAVNVDCFGPLEVAPEADAPEAKYAF